MWQENRIGIYEEIANFFGCLMTIVASILVLWIGTRFISTQSRRKL